MSAYVISEVDVRDPAGFERLPGGRVGKANGSRECAPDDKLRVPTL